MADVSATLEVFSPAEIARAAGVDVRLVRRLVAEARIPTIDGLFVAHADAADAVGWLRTGAVPEASPSLFAPSAREPREPAGPLVASALCHAIVLGSLAAVLGGSQVSTAAATVTDSMPVVLRFAPGPGGGGGGGGLRQPATASRATLAGPSKLRSPVSAPASTTRRAAKPAAPVRPAPAAAPPPPAAPEPAAPAVAPVVAVAGDVKTAAGVPSSIEVPESRGAGAGTGAGTGEGAGLGAGTGAGIGAGTDAGIGGGAYRPGTGISAPRLLSEVKPDYTEEARRRGIGGDVELEIVVRRDGRVGDVTLLRGLGSGLDQRAMDAVRQWRFAPATRAGVPVDVVVEVAVEFRLR